MRDTWPAGVPKPAYVQGLEFELRDSLQQVRELNTIIEALKSENTAVMRKEQLWQERQAYSEKQKDKWMMEATRLQRIIDKFAILKS